MRRAALVVLLTLVAVAAVLLFHGGAATVRGPQQGSWVFPRSGPYILGFLSPSPARLYLDERLVAEGTGLVQKRSLEDAGSHTFRLEGPDGARLLWHPPGRRGSPEYVSVASLSGAVPWGDALAASAVFLCVLTAFVLLVGPSRPPRAVAVVFVVALAVRLALAATGEQTWDEDEYWSAGRNYLLNLLDGDFSFRAWAWNHEHPPVTKYLAGLGALWVDGYLGAKIVFACLGAGAAALAASIAQRLFATPGTALGAGLCAALLPHLVAHGAIVGHETPSVFFGTLAVWIALRERPALLGRLALAGVALGLAVGTRYLNLAIAPVVILAAILGEPRWRTAVLAAVVIPAVAFAVVVAVSPLLWRDLLHTWHAAQEIARQPPSPEWFLGVRIVRAPRWYFALYLVVTTPLAVLGLALIAPFLTRERRAWLLLLAWLGAGLAVALSPIRRDGIRYALPALIPVAIAAGVALAELVRRWRALLGVAVVYLGVQLAWVWPHPLDYYQETVTAGRAQANHWFEVGWWGEGVSAAVSWVNEHAPPNARVGRYVIPTHLTWFRGDLWSDLTDRPGPERDVVVVNEAWKDVYGAPPGGMRLAHEVTAQGAVLARVYVR